MSQRPDMGHPALPDPRNVLLQEAIFGIAGQIRWPSGNCGRHVGGCLMPTSHSGALVVLGLTCDLDQKMILPTPDKKTPARRGSISESKNESKHE
jgi:hypothetical protein